MIGSVVLNDVANVPYDWILIVTPFQVLKKTKKKKKKSADFGFNTTCIFIASKNISATLQ